MSCLPVGSGSVPVLRGGVLHQDGGVRVLRGQRAGAVDLLQQRAAQPRLQPQAGLHGPGHAARTRVQLQPQRLLEAAPAYRRRPAANVLSTVNSYPYLVHAAGRNTLYRGHPLRTVRLKSLYQFVTISGKHLELELKSFL